MPTTNDSSCQLPAADLEPALDPASRLHRPESRDLRPRTFAADTPPGATTVGNYFIANYPPFSCWTPQYLSKFRQTLSRPAEPAPLGLYVHVPFCRQRCHYCYFRVYPRRDPADVDLYIDSVLKEFAMYLDYPAVRGRPIGTVYFGGGSPSYPDVGQIRRLLEGLQELSTWEHVEESTFECEPGTLSLDKLEALKELGIRRLSIGFQSLDDEVLRRSGRATSGADCLGAFHLARAAGFEEINIDLLAGLPGETDSSWQRTVDQVLELRPECVTIYQFELTYNSNLYLSIRAGREVPLPTWSAKRAWVAEAFHRCEAAGYTIGSGYMAVRDPHRWRFVYTVERFWHGADVLALGETAFGHLQDVHYQNLDTFETYTRSIAEQKLPVRRALRLRPEEKLRREVILLLKTGALDAAYFREKFGVELAAHFAPEFQGLRRRGLLEIDGDCIRLTRQGLLQVDWLLPDFYLPEHVGVRYT